MDDGTVIELGECMCMYFCLDFILTFYNCVLFFKVYQKITAFANLRRTRKIRKIRKIRKNVIDLVIVISMHIAN